MKTATHIFWAAFLLHGVRSSEGVLVYSSVQLRASTILRMKCGYWHLSICQWWVFFAPAPTAHDNAGCAVPCAGAGVRYCEPGSMRCDACLAFHAPNVDRPSHPIPIFPWPCTCGGVGKLRFVLILESFCGFLLLWTTLERFPAAVPILERFPAAVPLLPLASANSCGGASTRLFGSWLSALMVVVCGTFVRLYLGVLMAGVYRLALLLLTVAAAAG